MYLRLIRPAIHGWITDGAVATGRGGEWGEGVGGDILWVSAFIARDF